MTVPAFLTHLAFLAALALLSGLLTRATMRVAILDVPNHRSSHDRPTPKTGGIAVAATFFVGMLAMYLLTDAVRLPERSFQALLLLSAGLLAFAVLDDRYDLPATAKLAVQLAIAAGFSAAVATLPLAQPWNHLATIAWLILFMNAFNFMDGINGIASGTAMLAAVVLATVSFGELAHFVYIASLCLLGALAGFFRYNFPSGRVFLGDTGSQLVGFLLAGLAVIGTGADRGTLPFHVVPLLFSAFLFDVTVTLAARALAGRNLMQAHRQHLYQLLVRSGWSHARVTAIYLALAGLSGVGVLAVERFRLLTPTALALLLLALYAVLAAWTYRRAVRRGLIEPPLRPSR